MKPTIRIILCLLLSSGNAVAQRDIIIPTGAQITVPAGAQLCADRYFANNPGYGTLNYGSDPTRLCGVVIPVEFLSLSASYLDGNVTVLWRTATETDCAGYEVQRSSDRDSWQEAGFVPGHGTAAQEFSYSYMDRLPPGLSTMRVLYYRLKQMDNDGSFGYSPIVEVTIDGTAHTFALQAAYPNPASEQITLQYSLPDAVSARIAIYSTSGERVAAFENSELSGGGEHILSINTSTLAPGGYLVELVAGDSRLVRQFVVQR